VKRPGTMEGRGASCSIGPWGRIHPSPAGSRPLLPVRSCVPSQGWTSLTWIWNHRRSRRLTFSPSYLTGGFCGWPMMGSRCKRPGWDGAASPTSSSTSGCSIPWGPRPTIPNTSDILAVGGVSLTLIYLLNTGTVPLARPPL
jgi:hypothetical protein